MVAGSLTGRHVVGYMSVYGSSLFLASQSQILSPFLLIYFLTNLNSNHIQTSKQHDLQLLDCSFINATNIILEETKS